MSQFNLYYTDRSNLNESMNGLLHNCFRLVTLTKELNNNDHQKITSYCLSESPSEFLFHNNNYFPNFTFVDLAKQNITSNQLYQWSVPIDLIEHYQSYLISNHSLSTMDLIFNCTIPRFGPLCQYEFVYYSSHYSSLYEIVQDYYYNHPYAPTTLTCYQHLQCNHGPYPSCLDWTEICDGTFNCLDGRFDEEDCWQLEINECQENEYRCTNGQCIPQSFYQDRSLDCLDRSDEKAVTHSILAELCSGNEPSVGCEDLICDYGSFLASSCVDNREYLLLNIVFLINNQSVRDECFSTYKCILHVPGSDDSFCSEFCMYNNSFVDMVEDHCPEMLYIPNVPFFFGEIYLAYRKNDAAGFNNILYQLPYLCYKNPRYDNFFLNLSMVLFNDTKCFLIEFVDFSLIGTKSWTMIYFDNLNKLYTKLIEYHLDLHYNTTICDRSTMYQCMNSSKCISIHRLLDSKNDCLYMDDENIDRINGTNIFELLKPTRYKCQSTNKYIHYNQIENSVCDCEYKELESCEDEESKLNYIRRTMSFQTICDGFIELIPIIIDDRNETDETECEQWECINMYTRCNGIWNCPHGVDEVGCISFLNTLNCSSQHHLCVSVHSNQLICLPVEQANDGNIDCLGATDESEVCRIKSGYRLFEYDKDFYCRNSSSLPCIKDYDLCNERIDCVHGDDEQFCTGNRTDPMFIGMCWPSELLSASDVVKFFCQQIQRINKNPIIDFTIDGIVDEFKNDNKQTLLTSENAMQHQSIHVQFET